MKNELPASVTGLKTRDDFSMLLIGKTPVQPVQLIIQGRARRVYLKLESANQTGSMKARTAFSVIQSLEKQGLLRKNATIVESSSGNLGVALAYFCQLKGYPFLAVIDPKTTPENREKMRHFGAELEMVDQPDDSGGYLLSRLQRVKELCASDSAYLWTNQYANPANPLIHALTTAPEVYQQMHKRIDAIFIPVSTGGTLAGMGRFFRQVSPATRVIGVDVYGSVIFGTPAAPRKLTGIGSSKPSDFLSPDLYDGYMLVTDEEAFAFCWALRQLAKISVGGSSGAVLAACARYLAEDADARNAVCICADAGENYASTIFNPAWIKQQNLDISARQLGAVEAIENVPGAQRSYF